MIRLARYLFALTFILVLATSVGSLLHPSLATVKEGSFQLLVDKYAVTGQLSNAVVYKNGSISMTMTVNDNVQSPIGPVPMTVTGRWDGVLNDSTLSGSIHDVVGKVEVHFLFWSFHADFVGQGVWNGSLDGSNATGTFNGTVTFTSSELPQIPVNQPEPLSGTWNADFELESS
jgi:hypothetical protein